MIKEIEIGKIYLVVDKDFDPKIVVITSKSPVFQYDRVCDYTYHYQHVGNPDLRGFLFKSGNGERYKLKEVIFWDANRRNRSRQNIL